ADRDHRPAVDPFDPLALGAAEAAPLWTAGSFAARRLGAVDAAVADPHPAWAGAHVASLATRTPAERAARRASAAAGLLPFLRLHDADGSRRRAAGTTLLKQGFACAGTNPESSFEVLEEGEP